MKKQTDVLLIGAPLIDCIIPASEHFLGKIPGKKYGMETISESELNTLLLYSGNSAVESLGGSAANVAKTLAQLGSKAAFLGKIGNDIKGQSFIQKLEENRISSLCSRAEMPTGQALCFVTNDGLRTCRTYLGASEKLSWKDLDPACFQGIKLLHLEGYSLLKKGFTEKAMSLAKEANALISFDLGSFEVVQNHRDELLYLIKNYITILFGNDLEVKALLNLPAKEACAVLKELCKVSVVFEGAKGCYVGANRKEIFHTKAFKVDVVDTTGAGDFFAGAFINSLLNNRSLEFCANAGSFAASQVIQIYGTDLPRKSWENIQKFVQTMRDPAVP